jgi:CheY-like chemotaxis protein
MRAGADVLIVDDDRHLREAVATALGSVGFRVHGAPDGREAIVLLRAGIRPGVILLDLIMPTMNGWQFRTEQVRDPRLAHIPVVLFTSREDTRRQRSMLGAADAIPKPVDLDVLDALVRRYCSLS